MAGYQLVIDCTDPDRLARFWAAALGYLLEPPPAGFGSWDEYWRDVGVPEDELGVGADSVVDPEGGGPRIRFQVVPSPRQSRTGCTSTCTPAADGVSPSRSADSESTPRPSGWPAWAPPSSARSTPTASTTMPWRCATPKATSSTSTDGPRPRARSAAVEAGAHGSQPDRMGRDSKGQYPTFSAVDRLRSAQPRPPQPLLTPHVTLSAEVFGHTEEMAHHSPPNVP